MQSNTWRRPLIAVWLGMAANAHAATTQAEIDEATLAKTFWAARQAEAESRQKLAEAEAAAAKAKLGTLDLSKATAAGVEAKTLNVEGKILSYQAMDRIAAVIARDVSAHAKPAAAGPASAIVIVNDKVLNAVQQARSFKAAAAQLTKAIDDVVVPVLAADNAQCNQPQQGGAGVGVLGGIDVAVQIAQIFKVDRSLEGSDVTLDDFALALSVLAKLKATQTGRVVLASTYLPLGLQVSTPGAAAGSLSKQLDDLTDGQVKLEQRLAEISRRRDKLAAREADTVMKLPDACKKPFDDARRTYTSVETQAKSLKDRADKLVAAATSIDATSGAPVLQSMLQAEALATTYNGAYLLHLKPIAGGGTTYTKKNLLWSSVGVGGGAIVAYLLTGGADGGAAVTSGTVSEYGGFVKPEELGGFLEAQRDASQRK